MAKMFAGFLVEDPKGYDRYEKLIAVSDNSETLLALLKNTITDCIKQDDYTQYDYKIVEVDTV